MDQRSVVNRPSTFNIPLGPPQIPYAQQPPPQLPSQQQQHHPPRPPPPSIASILQSPTRQYYPPLEDPQEMQSRMEARLKRSVTLVYWWKAGADPIRMHQELSTFPLFALSEFKQLVSDLGLGPNTYVDAYNPNAGTWEQQIISAVRIVDSEQRLLYRTRISLLEGLRDSECPGLESEIRMQPPPRGRPPPPQSSTSATQVQQSPAVRPTKRLAPDTPTSPNKQLRSFYQHGTPTFPQSGLPGPSAPLYAPPAQTPSVAPSQLFSSPAVRSGPLSPFVHRDTPLAPAPTPSQQSFASTSNSAPHPESNSAPSSSTQNSTPDSPQIPTHPHPPLKRWPNDYAVCEIAAGFSRMDELVRTTPSLTQKAAFERVFGCRYVKSTVCRHRGVWKRADKGLKERFERMGPVEGALWGEFVKKTDFRREGTHSHTSSQGSNGRIKEQSGDGSNGGPIPSMEYHLPALGLGLSGHVLGGDAQPPMASLAPPGPPG